MITTFEQEGIVNGKILKVRKYKAGYEVRTILCSGEKYGCDDFTIKSAFTPDGDYIGNPKTAYFLCKKLGIKPEKEKPCSSICSIGFCEKEKKWYGWSHRAIFGFGIGSKVEKGNPAYIPDSLENFIEDCINFWKDDENKTFLNYEIFFRDKQKILTLHFKHIKPTGLVLIPVIPIPESFGRGEWEAKTLEDAKQMAIDFANDVA